VEAAQNWELCEAPRGFHHAERDDYYGGFAAM
jgi:hypothetical protein